MVVILVALFVGCVVAQGNCSSVECFDDEREKLVSLDLQALVGGNMTDTSLESQVEAVMFQHRFDLSQKFFDPPLPQRNWREIEDIAKATPLYQMLKTMPKGAVLHAHDIATLKLAVSIGSYSEFAYVDWRNDSSTFGFYRFSWQPIPGWTNVQAARRESSDVTVFDQNLEKALSFVTPPPYVNETTLWQYFDGQLSRVISLATGNLSLAREIYVQSFYNLVSEGMTHLEMRVFLSDVPMLTDAYEQFVRQSGSSLTIRFISESLRHDTKENVLQAMKNTVMAIQNNSNIVGYDLVDEEDACCSLYNFRDEFVAIHNFTLANNLPPLSFFFHCAETNNVTHAQSNLFDAMILTSKRLGHALGLRNHPGIAQLVKSRGVGLELCPVSNQLLRYVDDIRTHPGSSYLATGLPVTLSSDDPSIYNYDSAANTPDFFMAFLSWDLTLLQMKQIAKNSLIYSALSEDEKATKLIEFENLWKDWLVAMTRKK